MALLLYYIQGLLEDRDRVHIADESLEVRSGMKDHPLLSVRTACFVDEHHVLGQDIAKDFLLEQVRLRIVRPVTVHDVRYILGCFHQSRN
jgi:hypothetical protein